VPFYVGLDLGQSADFSAVAVIQSAPVVDRDRSRRGLHLRHLERYPLRTPYPDIVQNVGRLISEPRLTLSEFDPSRAQVRTFRPTLVVDNTGVGTAVTDMLSRAGLRFASVTITGDDSVHYTNRTWRVPKRDLVGALEVPFHSGRLKIAKGLTLWPILKEELLNFRRKVDLRTSHDSYEHWRESDHDDLVLACALACWQATKQVSRLKLVDVHGRVRTL
jgi:hypothetical protein